LESIRDPALGELVADQRQLLEIGSDPRQLVVEVADAVDDRRDGEHEHPHHDHQQADDDGADRRAASEHSVIDEPSDERVERHRQHDADDDPCRHRCQVDDEGDDDDGDHRDRRGHRR
jgi:hypothetical protein